VFDRDADAYAARGLRYVDTKLQDVEVRELKSGAQREKVGYADRQRCAAYLVGRLDRARSAEEVLGIVLQTLIAAHFADERVTAKSHRIGFTLPGSHGYHHDGIGAALAARREIPGLVEKIAGSWTAGLRATGLRPAYRTWTRAEIVEALRAWADAQGRPPQHPDWRKHTHEHPAAVTVSRRFGGWQHALQAAGLDDGRRRWTADEVLEAIHAHTLRHGRPPLSSE
jgi:Homing endonuclease associated repeat